MWFVQPLRTLCVAFSKSAVCSEDSHRCNLSACRHIMDIDEGEVPRDDVDYVMLPHNSDVLVVTETKRAVHSRRAGVTLAGEGRIGLLYRDGSEEEVQKKWSHRLSHVVVNGVHIIGAYAPHEGTNVFVRAAFWRDLLNMVLSITNTVERPYPLLVIGDLNAGSQRGSKWKGKLGARNYQFLLSLIYHSTLELQLSAAIYNTTDRILVSWPYGYEVTSVDCKDLGDVKLAHDVLSMEVNFASPGVVCAQLSAQERVDQVLRHAQESDATASALQCPYCARRCRSETELVDEHITPCRICTLALLAPMGSSYSNAPPSSNFVSFSLFKVTNDMDCVFAEQLFRTGLAGQ